MANFERIFHRTVYDDLSIHKLTLAKRDVVAYETVTYGRRGEYTGGRWRSWNSLQHDLCI